MPLAFDTLQRFDAIRAALQAAGAESAEPASDGWRLLDVGGFPCALADHLGPALKTLTLDTPECDRPDYRRGSGAKLPFEDGSFPAVVASDTLEHVPPEERAAFLGELVRVARRWVVVAGPLKSPLVDRVEEALVGLHDACFGRPHRWLGEHRANGLPEMGALAAALAPHGAVSIRANGSLANWTLLMGATLLDEHAPLAAGDPPSLEQALTAAYGAVRERLGPDDSPPAYRHVVVLDKEAAPAAVEELAARLEATVTQTTPSAEFELDLLLALLDSLAPRLAPPPDPVAGERAVDLAHIEQLERALALSEETITRASDAGGASPPARRRLTLRGLLGGLRGRKKNT